MFESIIDFLPEIERRLADRESPANIARDLGLGKTIIYDYKRLCFNVNNEAAKAWAKEQKKGHDERLAAGKLPIIDSLELLNKSKHRAQYLTDLEIGSEYTLADGKVQKLSLASAALYWGQGQQMTCDIIKAEMALQGEDAASRMAGALESFEDTRLAILEALDDDPEAKPKLTKALLERRRPDHPFYKPRYMGKGGPGPQSGPVAEGSHLQP